MCPHGAVCRLHLGQVSTWEHEEGCGDGVWGWASAPRLHPAAMGSSVMEDEGPPAPWMSHGPQTCVPMHDHSTVELWGLHGWRMKTYPPYGCPL